MSIEGIDFAMSIIQEKAQANELDYRFVMDCLKNYSSPRAKLGRLLKSGALIHVRKGLYLLGSRFKKSPYCLELLANMIYGPSYISLERALYIYGLIPEHVEMITSVTAKIGKEVRTLVGSFLYVHCQPKAYSVGVTIRQFSQNEKALIATPEKALIDMLTLHRGKVTSMRAIKQILLEDLRIEEEELTKLNLELIREIQNSIQHSAVYFLEKWLTEIKKQHD